MATQTLKNVILQLRTGSATQWAASTRILAVGEPGVETDSGRIKIGDGTNLWSALPWSGAAIGKSSTNGALTINGADVVVYVLPTATSDTLGGIKSASGTGKVTVDSATGTASVGNVTSADKLATARTISLSGDVTGSGSFNGSANLAITTALAGQAFTAGTYTKVTVNTKGIVTGVPQLSASDVPGGISAGKISGLGTAATKNTGTASGNIPVLGSDGKLDTAVLPALAITDTFTATSKADMLKLTAQTGDVCVISSGGDKGSYILTKDDPTVAANWQLLTLPDDAVTSVNGKTGVVTLTTANISEGSNLYWTQARFDTAFATKNSTALKDGATIVHTTDTVVINCGNA